MNETDIQYLRDSIKVAQKARKHGYHPFGIILCGYEGCPLRIWATTDVVMGFSMIQCPYLHE